MGVALLAALQDSELPVEPLMTAQELASLLRMDLGDLYRESREGIIPSIRWGRKVRFRYSDVLAALQRRQMEVAQ